jgi:DNA-binding GntR family transcriptional regulator
MIQSSITAPTSQSLLDSKELSHSQAAYQAIRHKIISLELSPGSVIDESSLRKKLGLGRTPIREALQRLSMEKLVTIIPRRGTFVTQIRLTDLQRLSEARLVMEALAVRLACQRGTEAHWQHMAQVLEHLDRTEVIDNEAMITADEACHHIIYKAADNEFLEDTLTALYALSLRLWYYAVSQIGGMREAVLEHRRILDALRAGDEEQAVRLIEQHIQTFHNEIQSVVLGAPASTKHS